jgi:hypothetical protein
MASEYQLVTNFDGVKRAADEAHIPNAAGNLDWQAYQAWLAEGNTPDPPSPPSIAVVIAQSAQALSLSDARSLNRQGRTQEAVDAILDLMEHRA